MNVFEYENKKPFPLYISSERFKDHMELLLIYSGENKHYVLIKDFNRFMFYQTKNKNKKYFCMYCLQCFSKENVLEKHSVGRAVVNNNIIIILQLVYTTTAPAVYD